MIARFLANRWFMLFLTGATLLLLIFLIYERAEALLTTFRLENYQNLLDDGETIAILLVGLGVVLESRETLLRKSQQGAPKTEHPSVRDEDFEYYGVLILILGLLIEMGTQFIRFVNNRLGSATAPLIARIVIQGLGVIALFVLVRVIILLLTPDPQSGA